MKQRSSSYSPLRQITSPVLKVRRRMAGSFSYALRNVSRWSSLKDSKISNRLSRCHNSHGGIFSLTGWFDTTPSQSCVTSDVNRVSFLFPLSHPLNADCDSRKVLAGDYATRPMKDSDFNTRD